MPGTRFFTNNRSGFTLVECVMSIIVLSMVLLPVLYSFNLANSSDIYAENVYKSSVLLEGVMAEACNVNTETLSRFSQDELNNIWELIYKADSENLYEFTLIFEETNTGGLYTFSSNIDLIPAKDEISASFIFTPESEYSSDDIYNLVIEEYTPTITIDDSSPATYIAVCVSSDSIIEIKYSGPSIIYVDIYGDCPISYSGSGLFVERRSLMKKPSYIIHGAVYSKDKSLLNTMTCGGTY